MEEHYDIVGLLKTESFQNQEKQYLIDSIGGNYNINTPDHFTTHRDRKDNIPAFFSGWE